MAAEPGTDHRPTDSLFSVCPTTQKLIFRVNNVEGTAPAPHSMSQTLEEQILCICVSMFGLCVCVVYGVCYGVWFVVYMYYVCVCVWYVGIVWCVYGGYVDSHGEGSPPAVGLRGHYDNITPAFMNSLSEDTERRMPNPCLPPLMSTMH